MPITCGGPGERLPSSRRCRTYLAVWIHLRHLDNPRTRSIPAVKDTVGRTHGCQKQRVGQVAKDEVCQLPVLLLEALKFFLARLAESLRMTTSLKGATNIVDRCKVDLLSQRLLLIISSKVCDDATQRRIEFGRAIVTDASG